ncbi:MAG: hypothetical protein IKD18_06070, partial [Clostridia bacterium]|nr:hypothetical protein [Clostridia bacterium]
MTANFSDVAKTDKNFAVETKLDREDLVLYDVDEAPFRVYGLFRENGKYCRLPRAVAEKVNKGVLARHANTAGGRVRFITDSSFVAIVAKMENVGRMAHFPLTASAGFDLYADGVFIKSFVPDKNMEDGYESLISLNGKEMREITIHFPLYSDVCRLHVGLE